MTAVRSDRYQRVSTLLAARSDGELAELTATGRPNTVGVGGGTAVLDVEGVSVFVKRIPLTERELAHSHSTANLFDLPVFCQYGIGGPSINAWRELAANVIVTDGVLAGRTHLFPMLYHWRVLPGRSPVAAEHEDIDTVVAEQGDSPAVRARLEALVAAPCSLVLFCEYIPYPLPDWLRENPVGKAATVERQFADIVTFLSNQELLHMDGHFGNIRSDGERIYLSDFGLATSPHFELSSVERDFVERHVTHDADYAAMRLVNWLVTGVCGMPTTTKAEFAARNDFVSRCAAGRIPQDVPSVVATILARHAPAAAEMNAFYWKLFDGDFSARYPTGRARVPQVRG
ncbi:serine/threonine protein phosphatase [Nocardia callitridis]|uniref:Serine/threonine protein phosphatase n=1 Tax=Nocardia callitridis TaxID=648753 RepID=A0ABP9K4P3_9NOCA